MADPSRVGRIQKYNEGSIAAPTPAPTVAGDGFECGEYEWVLFRLVADEKASRAVLRFHSMQNPAAPLDTIHWIEMRSERQSTATGGDYTRNFFMRAADKFDYEVVSLTGTVTIFIALA